MDLLAVADLLRLGDDLVRVLTQVAEVLHLLEPVKQVAVGEQLGEHLLGQVDEPGAAPALGEHRRAGAGRTPVHDGIDVDRVHAPAVEGEDGQELDELADHVGRCRSVIDPPASFVPYWYTSDSARFGSKSNT